MTTDAAVRTATLAALAGRAATASICPSEVARAVVPVDGDWRERMPQVRRVASALAVQGLVVATQGTDLVPADRIEHVAGPIRLRRGPAFDTADPSPGAALSPD